MGDYLVTVCDRCLTASCWHGEFMCWESGGAGLRIVLASELRKLGREHPDNFSKKKLIKVYGREPNEVPEDTTQCVRRGRPKKRTGR